MSLPWLIFLTLGLFGQAHCLYEDQAGKFDWRHQMVGRPLHVLWDSSGGDRGRLLVGTEENVLAALDPRSGSLLWRRVLERGDGGRLHLLTSRDDGTAATFSGANLLRRWNPSSGLLVSETALDIAPPESPVDVFVLDAGNDQLLVLHISTSTVVHTVAMDTGDVTTVHISTPWAPAASCVAGEKTLLCWDAQAIYTLSTSSPALFSSQPLPAVLSANQKPRLQHLGADMFSVTSTTGDRLSVVRTTPSFQVVREMAADFACLSTVNGEQVLYGGKNIRSPDDVSVELQALAVAGRGAPSGAPSGHVSLSLRHGAVSGCHVAAAPPTGHALLIGDDDAVTMATVPGSVVWTREEALAHILAVEVVDLPMSAGDVSIEEEFDPDAGPLAAFLRRVTSQQTQLTSLVRSVLTGEALTGPAAVTHLTRDRFNLHKMLVVVTAAGKLLGLHSETGKVHWAVPVTGLPDPLTPELVLLGLQRGTAHFPHAPQAVLLAGRRLVTFNPITGGDLHQHLLSYDVSQASLLPQADSTHLKPLVLLDSVGQVHVFPESATSIGRASHHKLFFYSVDVSTGVLEGRAVTKELWSVPTWRLDLSSQGQTIQRVLAKSPQERVHSQGRVLADRSVLYKYSNPNLLLIITDAPDPVHKHATSVYLVDAVSGRLVHSQVQRRVRCPCHAVHSENWLVYSVYNEKARRTEVTSIELFEGKVQSNATAFSSLDGPPEPMVERQTFIFPTQIEAMRETITEKGITTKFVLFALASGSVVALNKALMDPRRPLAPGRGADEGLPPYQPELPLPTVAVVNYNQTVRAVRGLVTAPSGLESTCLVLVHGLDLFHTRMFPSNMFDQLKDDFDSSFIVLVLVGLISAAVISRRLSQRRALLLAWK